MSNIYLHEMHADKRWFHGRLIQIVTRSFCRLAGHWFTHWRWEYPDEDLSEGDGAPPTGVALLWTRRCRRGCGTVQFCHALAIQKDELP